MNKVSSRDGTQIAYDEQGQGPALILINGAMNTRSSGSNPALADLLAQHLTVYSFDRRGRGDSGDTMPYAVAREIEDVEALIAVAGGTASLYGHSSGACLALEVAAALGDQVTRLAMYEAPYNDDPEARRAWSGYIEQLTDSLAAGHRGDAVALFMTYVGIPAAQIAGMREQPFWAGLEALAPTLSYDHTGLLGQDAAIPVERAARIPASALVMYGGASPAFMGETAHTLSHAIPAAELRTLEGQTHEVDPQVLAPELIGFFARA
jgi:pimeloyl-ACP methyl ester carboxylesterase